MSRLLITIFVAALIWPSIAEQSKAIAITNVTLIDATGALPQTEMTVVVVGNRIAQLGKTKNVRLPQDAQIINGRSKILIPGLWDMHTHLTLATEKALPQLIAYGVTGARDLGSDLKLLDQWRVEIGDKLKVGPRIFRAGPFVDGQKELPADRAAATLFVGTADEARQAVKTLKQRGVDLIKIHNALPKEAFFVLLGEARRQKLPVVVHLPRTGVSMEDASDAGVVCFEHIENVLENVVYANPTTPKSTVEALSEFSDQQANQLFARFARNGTFYSPTLVAYKEATWAREKTNPIVFNARLKALERFKQLVGIMQRSGVRLLAASDFAWPDGVVQPGHSLHDDLALMVEAGLTPMQALQSATRNPALSLGVGDRLGTVEKGKLADLVLLDADPLADIHNTRRIFAVIANGRLFRQAELQKLLAQTAK